MHAYNGTIQSDYSDTVMLGLLPRASAGSGFGSGAVQMTDWLYRSGTVVQLLTATDLSATAWVCR